jgi:hypothetical protein
MFLGGCPLPGVGAILWVEEFALLGGAAGDAVGEGMGVGTRALHEAAALGATFELSGAIVARWVVCVACHG